MRVRSVLLAAFLFAAAVSAGLLLPVGMTWFQAATTPKTVEYPVQTVNLEYSQDLNILQKYTAVHQAESFVNLEAGHTTEPADIVQYAHEFLQTAFPNIRIETEPDIQPALIVADGHLISVWMYHNVYSVHAASDLGVLTLLLDDATGAVLSLQLDAASTGLLPVLGEFYSLPEDYWLQTPDTSQLMAIMAERFTQALEQSVDGLEVEAVDAYHYAPAMPGDLVEPVYFSQHLILRSGDDALDLELWAEESVLLFNY